MKKYVLHLNIYDTVNGEITNLVDDIEATSPRDAVKRYRLYIPSYARLLKVTVICPA